MTDLEITKACAEAMELDISCSRWKEDALVILFDSFSPYEYYTYAPLTNDAQAMALVKKFGLHTGFQSFDNLWGCLAQDGITKTYNTDLNRAICECVAKMKKAKP